MIFENDTIGFPAFSEKLYQPFSRKMEEAARYWGSSHDDLLLKLCLFIAEKKVGKDCINLLQMISDDIKDLDQLREKSQLPQNQFDSYIRKLEHEQIISFNPLEVNILSIFRTVLSPQLVNFAYENAKLREDKEYVEKVKAKFDKKSEKGRGKKGKPEKKSAKKGAGKKAAKDKESGKIVGMFRREGKYYYQYQTASGKQRDLPSAHLNPKLLIPYLESKVV